MISLNEQLLSCLEISKAITSTLNIDQILMIFLKRLSKIIPARNWTLFLLDEERRELYFELVVGLECEKLHDVRIKLYEGIAGTVAATGKPLLVDSDIENDPRFSKKIDELTGFTTRSIICLPLKINETVIGVLEIINIKNLDLFKEESLPFLCILAEFMAIAITNAKNFKKIEYLAITDDVTGFYNTRFLHEHLDGLLQQEKNIALAFLDLDDFKTVVDAHGHLLGSKMLKEVAMIIDDNIDICDSLVRYGGDEYVVIMPGQNKSEAYYKMIEVRLALDNACFLKAEGLNVRISASFGIAGYPEDAVDKKILLQIADDAMYQSKALGKDIITMSSGSTQLKDI